MVSCFKFHSTTEVYSSCLRKLRWRFIVKILVLWTPSFENMGAFFWSMTLQSKMSLNVSFLGWKFNGSSKYIWSFKVIFCLWKVCCIFCITVLCFLKNWCAFDFLPNRVLYNNKIFEPYEGWSTTSKIKNTRLNLHKILVLRGYKVEKKFFLSFLH